MKGRASLADGGTDVHRGVPAVVQVGAIQIQSADPTDNATCELAEVGGYVDPAGNNFWGVETFVGDDGSTYILGSDRDSGLWIFIDP